MTPLGRVQAALEAHGCRRNGRAWLCPAHDDSTPSLSLAEGQDGRVLLNCHAGCTFEAILTALKLDPADLRPNQQAEEWTPFGPAVATYVYHDAKGRVIYGKCRTANKDFPQWRPDPSKKHGRAWSLKGVTTTLYHLPAVLEAIERGERIYVCEGEKDADAVTAAGAVATTNPEGAGPGKWKQRYSATLADAAVTIIVDDDEPGRARGREIFASLAGEGCRATLVRPAAGKDAYDHLAAGKTLDELLPLEDEPAAEAPPVNVARDDGKLILDEVAATYRRYVAFASDHQAVALALWAAHTHAVDAADATPYMHVSSAEASSGKTRVLEVAELLVARPWLVIEPSEAVTFRMIEAAQPTLLLDEVDAIWGKDADNREGLRAVLNAGYRRGATVPRCVGNDHELKDFPVFGAKALAGLRELPGTLASRTIPIRLQRRTRNEKVEKFRRRRAAAALEPLRERLAAWAALVGDELVDADPAVPESLSDRQTDIWEPLLAIADAAGGDWPKLAHEAAVHLHGHDPAADPSVGVLLLGHVREAFTIRDEEENATGHHEELPTAALLRRLVGRDDGPWAGWWGQAVAKDETRAPAARLARLLAPFGIEPKQLWVDGKKTRGYAWDGFAEAWSRYLPPTDLQDGRTVDRRSEALFDFDGESADMASDQASTVLPSPMTVDGEGDVLGHEGPPPPTDTDNPGQLPGFDPGDPRRFTR